MRNLSRWLLPGMHIKRWLLLLTVGMLVIGTGIGIGLRAALLSSPDFALNSPIFYLVSLKWMDNVIRVPLIIVVGATLAGLALLMTTRSVVEAVRGMADREVATFSNGSGHPNGNGSANGKLGKAQLVDIIYDYRIRQAEDSGPRIVCIGGGTGMPTMLRGLKGRTANLTAVVTMADDGGSSGRIREEFGMLPPGDIRNNLVALADDEQMLSKLFQYRFTEGQLAGHSFGNLFIVAMAKLSEEGFEGAIRESSRVLAIRGRVLPSSLTNLNIGAELADGRIVRGESAIPHAGQPIKRVFAEPTNAEGYPESLQAIAEADLIVMGPGSLYTSVIPNFLVAPLAAAVANSAALKVYVCNVATQPGETDGYSALDHVQAIQRHAGRRVLDYCIVNSDSSSRQAVKDVGVQAVLFDPAQADRWKRETGVTFVGASVVNEDNPLRHNPTQLASTLLELYDQHAAPALVGS